MRLAAYVSEQCQGAEALINGSRLNDEARSGLLATTVGLRNAFSLPTIQQAISSHIPSIDTSLSGFAILESATRMEDERKKPPEINDICAQIDEILQEITSLEVDPIVSDTITRHLTLLKTMLLHIEVFGADSAISTYLELLVRLGRLEKVGSEQGVTLVQRVFKKVEKWSSLLATIDRAINAGSSILSHFKGSEKLLTYLPNP